MSIYKLPETYWSHDYETTGLPKDEDVSGVDFIEIGYGLIKNKELDKTSIVQAFAKPIDKEGKQVPLLEKITKITGIKDEDLKDIEPTLVVAEKTLKQLVFSDLPIVGHNVINFDKLFNDKYCDILGWPRISEDRYIDCAAIFKAYRQAHRKKSTSWELPYSQKQFYKWAKATLERSWTEDQVKYNLDAACGYLAIPLFGIEFARHRAIYDAIVTHKILEQLREEMGL
jgi:DNA polymerase III epsilon subunit-like protein